MKKLCLIGGPMGVGKTSAAQTLKTLLYKSVLLDGDWCWDMHPFVVTDETKAMAMDNIVYLLSSFLRCSEIDHVIFCWVMHEQTIIDTLLTALPLDNVRVVPISLICNEQTLMARLQKDIDAGLRMPDVIDRSISRLDMYPKLNTLKIDTSVMTIEETANAIAALLL